MPSPHEYEELREDVEELKTHMYGRDGNFGLLHQMKFLWRTHIIWPLCSASAIVGFILAKVQPIMDEIFHITRK